MKSRIGTMLELPPTSFSNLMNVIHPGFDFSNWRKTKEWEIFVHGYNHGLDTAIDASRSRFDMGMASDKLYGKNT